MDPVTQPGGPNEIPDMQVDGSPAGEGSPEGGGRGDDAAGGDGVAAADGTAAGDGVAGGAGGPGAGGGPSVGVSGGVSGGLSGGVSGGSPLSIGMTMYEEQQLAYTRANYTLSMITTITALVTSIAAIISLFWWWTQHYLLYRRNHIHHRHVAREEARAARSLNRHRSRIHTGTSVREPSVTFREPTYRRATVDLQRELETIVNEARARQERLRVALTMQELEAAVEVRPETAPAA